MMDFVLSLFEEAKAEHANDPILAPAIQAGWNKVTKYYNLTSNSPSYAATVVLDPSMKWQYFESN